MKEFSFSDLTGVMGSTEMECALARMLNIAQEHYTEFENLHVTRSDFNMIDPYEGDGFFDLIRYGWIEREPNGSFTPVPELVKRVTEIVSRIK